MPVEENDLEKFMDDYSAVKEKHQMDFIAIPQFVPNGQGKWEVQIVFQVVSLKNKEPLIKN